MIHLIAAVAENNTIGKDNKLLWHIPRDLKRFKKLTLGHPMIMGRKTFESFGSKPLPKRMHIVISSKNHEDTEQVKWVKSLEEAIDLAQTIDEKIYIIGGGSIYKQAMEFADQLDITRVHANFEGDTFFPEIPKKFSCIEDELIEDPALNFTYSFKTYIIV